jgi:hypothetical protein
MVSRTLRVGALLVAALLGGGAAAAAELTDGTVVARWGGVEVTRAAVRECLEVRRKSGAAQKPGQDALRCVKNILSSGPRRSRPGPRPRGG